MILGEAVFVRNDNPLAFSRDELVLIEALVGRASLSLDNARRYSRERAAALALQRNLLPRHISGGVALEVASRYLPADTHEGIGGDWFDAIPLSRDRVGLVVGDVVGHGINAAARMGQLRPVVQTLADLDLPPDVLLARLDRLVLRLGAQDSGEGGDLDLPASMVMGGTCLYVVYDPVNRQCTMARAGHPPPAILYPDGAVVFPEIPAGPPIGLGTMAYQSATVELPEGSTIALYTDGLVESRTADLGSGMERLRSALAGPRVGLEELCERVLTAMTNHRAAAAGREGTRPAEGSPGASPASDGSRPAGAAPGPDTSHASCGDDIALLLARTRPPIPRRPAPVPHEPDDFSADL
ncbi:Stage II sporulation protein E (SpoIIE) [Streptomyces sp. DvalAA-14]|nr:Stage II sporulation protein E (SpoIIE) [Streptomyces sp. DvalAA-14]